MTNVFISYRREDTTAGFAALIHDRLASSRTCDVFMDIDNLPFGVDFEEHIRMALRACDVALVLIGALWLDVHDADGTRRLDNPADVHRLEIAEVLRRGTVPVIPVLFGSVKMPRTEELPEEIRALTRRHAFYWHLEQTSASQLQGIRDAVRRIRRSMPEEETTNLGAAPVDVEGDLPVTEEVGIGRALSARVIGLCAELLSDLGDTATAAAIQDIQGPLLSSGHGTKVLSDAGQADRALQRLDALSWTDPGLSFIRDRGRGAARQRPGDADDRARQVV